MKPSDATWEQSVSSTIFVREDKRKSPRQAAARSGPPPLSCRSSGRSTLAQPFTPAIFQPSEKWLRAFIGLDGGSTSTKAVLLSESGDVLCKAYQLSEGNPIEDTKQLLSRSASRWSRRERTSKCLVSAQPAMPRISCATCCTPMLRWWKP